MWYALLKSTVNRSSDGWDIARRRLVCIWLIFSFWVFKPLNIWLGASLGHSRFMTNWGWRAFICWKVYWFVGNFVLWWLTWFLIWCSQSDDEIANITCIMEMFCGISHSKYSNLMPIIIMPQFPYCQATKFCQHRLRIIQGLDEFFKNPHSR